MIVALLIGSVSLLFTALAKIWKFGPWLEDDLEPSDTGTPEYSPPVPTTPVAPPVAPQPPSRANLDELCTAIRDFEGRPGDANYRNNNPGNCRYHLGGYLPMYGNVRRSPGGFAIFPTYALGWLYLQNMIKGQIAKNPNQTLYEFMTRYAPESDNNPTPKYAAYIATRLGVDIHFRMGDLVLT